MFSLCIFGVLTALIFLQPLLYRLFPSDFDRHVVLEDYFKKLDDKGEVIIFGDSRSMFGVDSRIVKDQLKIAGQAYNLSSVSQDFYESSYYYSRVKKETKLVVQCISAPILFNNSTQSLPDSKAISMYLSGYRINKETKHLIPNYNKSFDHSSIANYYSSRSYFKTYVHNFLRPIFDDEVYKESNRHSKFFPHYYTQDKLPNYSKYVFHNCQGYDLKQPSTNRRSFIQKAAGYFNDRNIEYVLVLMPVNPDVCPNTKVFEKFATDLRQIDNLMVIDLSSLLESRYFYDRTHANKMGAKVISDELGKKLKMMKLKLQ